MSSKPLRSLLFLLMLTLSSFVGPFASAGASKEELNGPTHSESGYRAPTDAINDVPPEHQNSSTDENPKAPNTTCADLVSEPQVLNPEFVR